MSIQIGPHDAHLIVSHAARTMGAYRADGTHVWTIDALTSGVGGGQDNPSGDTPFGTYRVTGERVPTTSTDTEATREAYGPLFWGLEDVDGQERSRGRAGIGVHGGGTADGPEGSQLPQQQLVPTKGCIRLHNEDLMEKFDPLVEDRHLSGGDVWITVGP